jgi:hypothetical protein
MARRRLPEIERQLNQLEPKIKQLQREINQRRDAYQALERERSRHRNRRRVNAAHKLDKAVGSKKLSVGRLKLRLDRLVKLRDQLYVDAGLRVNITLRAAERERIQARHYLLVTLQEHTSAEKWRDLYVIARQVGVPEEYINCEKLMYCDRELKFGRRIDFFFGGDCQPDGPGHGHIVVKRTQSGAIKVAYVRLPGETTEDAA